MSDAKNVLDEVWVAIHNTVRCGEREQAAVFSSDLPGAGSGTFKHDAARARFAAQAPRMAREFLRVIERDAECPSCNRYVPDEEHKTNCALLSIFRDAGVLP